MLTYVTKKNEWKHCINTFNLKFNLKVKQIEKRIKSFGSKYNSLGVHHQFMMT